MDEVDAIGGRRFSQGTSADREIQRTLMELLNQLDGFDTLGKVKMIMVGIPTNTKCIDHIIFIMSLTDDNVFTLHAMNDQFI
jgi:ATP-dependent 26S proteasome regulatory subunit